ncbi:hypothetical protein J4419_01475 [Candidatus Woesearchaeota archaeon]|nr:hypothetical protein [Candidatus Woesearchaeota archaeon]
MKGKAESRVSVGGMIFALVVLLVVLAVFFRPSGGILGKVGSKAYDVLVWTGLFKQDYHASRDTVPATAQEDYNALKFALAQAKDAEGCRISVPADYLFLHDRQDEKSGKRTGFQADFSQAEGKAYINLVSPKRQVADTQVVDGITLCLIAGKSGDSFVAENFYRSIVDKEELPLQSTYLAVPAFTLTDTLKVSAQLPDGKGTKISESVLPFFYVPKKGVACLIPYTHYWNVFKHYDNEGMTEDRSVVVNRAIKPCKVES